MFDMIFKYSQGNPGAMMFLMELFNNSDSSNYIPIFIKIERCNITGTNLYVLYSDLGNKNMDTVCKICESVPDDILIDACSRQDYSGRELIKPYMNIDTQYE